MHIIKIHVHAEKKLRRKVSIKKKRAIRTPETQTAWLQEKQPPAESDFDAHAHAHALSGGGQRLPPSALFLSA